VEKETHVIKIPKKKEKRGKDFLETLLCRKEGEEEGKGGGDRDRIWNKKDLSQPQQKKKIVQFSNSRKKKERKKGK